MGRTSSTRENRTSGLDLLVRLEPGRGPRRRQLEEQLRDATRSGRLAAGSPMPSTRALARELGVSRGVIVDAYAQLSAEGYLVARQGAPTRVAEAPPAAAAPGGGRRQAGGGALATEGGGPLARRRPGAPVGSGFTAAPADRPPRFDFRPGGPDPALFPRSAWLASLRRALRSAPDARLDYGDPRGAPELRAALARYLGRARGVAAHPDLVVVTSGMAQGMAVLARALVKRGEGRIGVEDPSSAPGRDQLSANGLEVLPVPVDEDGLRVDVVERLAPDSVFAAPAHQFPLGVVLAAERRAALIDWAGRTGGLVLEDDYDAEYRYDRAPVGAVQGLAPELVAYAGSVSKTLAPGLRLGWMVVPERLAESVIAAKALDDLGTPVVEQLALADFLERGELDRHLRRTRGIYRGRRDALVAALARHLPGCPPGGVAAGLHLVVPLPPRADERAILDRARAQGIGLYGLSEHRVRPGPPALLLGYGRIAEPAIDAAAAELAAAVRYAA
jgi:GntR family transcriptional regulator / MocR family aminotransferase